MAVAVPASLHHKVAKLSSIVPPVQLPHAARPGFSGQDRQPSFDDLGSSRIKRSRFAINNRYDPSVFRECFGDPTRHARQWQQRSYCVSVELRNVLGSIWANNAFVIHYICLSVGVAETKIGQKFFHPSLYLPSIDIIYTSQCHAARHAYRFRTYDPPPDDRDCINGYTL